jgi:hypothetical protein
LGLPKVRTELDPLYEKQNVRRVQMLRTLEISIQRLMLVGLLACSVFASGVAIGQALDPQQKEWIAK